MRKMIDTRCTACGEIRPDKFIDLEVSGPLAEGGNQCPCGGVVERVMLAGHASAVHGDDIPGGLYIKHGLCHDDGTPRRFDSKSEIRRAAAEKGLTWGATNHVTNPRSGSDKNPHTSRWV